MDEWKILKQETINVGSNNFIEVSLKQPPGSDAKLIGISKGWTTDDDQKRYKSNIVLSLEKKDELINLISQIDEEF